MASPSLFNSDQSIVPRHSLYHGKRSIIKYAPEQKRCALCDELIDDVEYSEHVASCDGAETPVIGYSADTSGNRFGPITPTSVVHDKPQEDTEHAPDHPELAGASRLSASKPVAHDESNDDYVDSVVEMTNNASDSSLSSTETLEIDDRPNSDSRSDVQLIHNADEETDDVYNTPRAMSFITSDEEPKKVCILCREMIDETEFINHMMDCQGASLFIETIEDEPQDFILNSSVSRNDHHISIPHSDIIQEKMQDCIICFKPIKMSEYVRHVHACLPELTPSETMKKQRITCFSCGRSMDPKDNLSREISCPSRHIYCLTCLQYSMEKFARTRSVPLCHLTLCDYELSRHDIALLPLQRRISDQLIRLAQGQQRPQCSKCHFYIDVNETEDFYAHVDVCDGDLIPCQYCSCPYATDQFREHEAQCRNERSSRNDKLIHFLTRTTKYPFTKQQINLFIRAKTKGNHEHVDPLEMINALTVFGSVFPYDIPTKECDTCMEPCPYDDIYVFDCADKHKVCYSCYYRSCETKMSNGEILTCGICTNPLRDGELNQLRILKEEIKRFRDYQMRKTLDVYSNQTRGIVKCPNQNCSWIAESDDPTHRFQVQCPSCQREFCSLCNQQYHYRTKCQQLPQITQQWYLWCQKERERYIIARAREDETYAARLNDYNQQINENENRNQDLHRRYEELMRDEQYKAENCRLCPSCQRVVQRLAGCDTMICGQDAHGGNVQSGCGAKFNWQQAQPYTATATFQAQQSVLDLPKPEQPIVQHTGVQCDQCHQDVMGIRFDCVHCPTLTFCEKCEQQATLNHSHENEQRQQQSHVFRLIIKPEEVASE